ncbi:Flagellar motor switch protein FliN [Thalassocella blandensis]|nr:Flagellar motor switch protein FliN [Thalassocella blandensis]
MENNIEKIALDEISSEITPVSKNLVSRDLNLVGHVNVGVSVNVGTAEISIEKLFTMKEGEVIKLAQELNAPLTLLVDNKAVAKGVLVSVDENFGVQITEVMK